MIKSLLKHSLSANLFLPFKKDCRVIFIYHDISEKSALHHSENYSTTPARFKEQIHFLSRHFEWVDLEKIHQSEPFNHNVASLVFDDGFKSVETQALPFLSEKKIPFSVFVNQCAVNYNRLWVSDLLFNKRNLEKTYGSEFTNDLESSNAFSLLEKNKSFQNKLHSLNLEKYAQEQIYLDTDALLKLHQHGVLIGNHGSYHANLSLCDETSLRAEICDNKKFIEDLLNTEVKHYALAFGKKEHVSSRALELIQECGHPYIYSSNPNTFGAGFQKKLIPRIGLTNNSTREILFYLNRQFIKKTDL